MKTHQINNSLLLIITGTSLVIGSCFFLMIESIPGHTEVKKYLMKRLIIAEPYDDISEKSSSKAKNILYILGGSKDSLKKKFITVADLYRSGKSRKILMLSMPGITEYDPSIGRNLTNDEWVIKSLLSFGIKREHIEFKSVKSGFFGTFTEAERIAAVAKQEGYDNLVLVTAPYHTMRAWKSFSEFLKNTDVKLFLYGSSEDNNLRDILMEYFKLLFYENILLNDN